ncbi:MAG TPA: ABC transporter ATP-binding protein, partial [Steroidobacteraceae bacterium]|nr:ABC transporter ATP-binding protein [Steroidobacteraceae bacterium]
MLEIIALSKTYGGEGAAGAHVTHVLDAVSFEVARNQFVCLLGASGCGKTTLLRIVAGLTVPDGGEIQLEGRQVTGPGQDRSLVFQNYGLLPWRSVMGNVEFGLEMRGVRKAERRAISQKYIDRVGLTGYERHYPHQISGGMQQRTALARAFSKDPKVLLMDEPFAAVDMQTREMLQDELLKIWTSMQTTVLFVTHSIEEAIYLGDRVLVMGARPGRIKADIATELPRPRDEAAKSSPRFDELRRLVRDKLRHDEAP